MTFWEHFLRLLPKRPKSALTALYWHLTRRKVRARNVLRAASMGIPFAYDYWITANERIQELTRRYDEALKGWSWHPRFTILLHGSEKCFPDQLALSKRSVEEQIYPHWRIVEQGAETLVGLISASDGDFIVPLRIGDRLAIAALFRFAEAANANRQATIFYGDEDRISERGRRTHPWFKPSWNRELFLAQDYLSAAWAIESTLALDVSERIRPNDIATLLLTATSEARAIQHIPHILCHVGSSPEVPVDRMAAVSQHLGHQGATCSTGPFQTVKVQWPLPTELPLVSIIVPTKDKLELLRPCIESVLERTNYPAFELLVVDNGSCERRTIDYLDQLDRHPSIRVLRYPAPYNFSKINNFAVTDARGSYLCLLNNDTEVIEPDWLTELMRYAIRKEIGAAGAKLLYSDGSIQHAGVVIGLGEAAGHQHRFQKAHDPGYFAMAHVPQFVSAVTAACLVVEKAKFETVGGFDEEFAVAFNDVDFCLKIQAAGWRNIYVPQAVLVHYESKSRGSDAAPQNIDRFRRELQLLQQRWGTKTYQDPLLNPNLDRYSETFIVALD